MVTKTYVMYLMAGSCFTDCESRKVSSRNLAFAKRNMPLNAFAFYFFDQTSTKYNGELLTGKMKNMSKVYLPDAKLFTAGELKKLGRDKDGSGLYRKAKERGGKLLQCRVGNWQPFNEATDRII